jgi:hypothetical protein
VISGRPFHGSGSSQEPTERRQDETSKVLDHLEQKEREMRLIKLLGVPILVAAMIGGTGTPTLADGPYTINMRLRAHKAIEFDPGWVFDASPCFVATGDLTEVFNAEAHALAAGIDQDGDFVPPLHVEKTVEESVLFVPYDPTLPTYAGHATVHLRNFEDSANAGFTNTVVLRGTDCSHVLLHEDVHILVRPNGIVLFVDHARASC